MAYLLTNKDNSRFLLSKDIEQLQLQLPSYDQYKNGLAGKMVTISNEDFIRIQSQETFNYDGTNLNFTGTIEMYYHDEIAIQEYISNLIQKIESIYNKHKNNSFGTDLEAYKTLLGTVNTSSFTYPYTSSVEKYLQDQGHSIISPLQMM